MPDKQRPPDIKDKVSTAAAAHAQAVSGAAGAHAKLVAGDLWQALKTDWRMQVLTALLVISILGWHAPYISTILYPFKLFTTIIHEACHALAARMTGGNVLRIVISPDEAGATYFDGGIEVIATAAGYLGASLFGALLIWLGRKPETARSVLQTIGIVILSLTVFYGGGTIWSFLWMLGIGAILVLFAQKTSTRVCHGLLLMLAVQTTLQASFQIQYLLYKSQNSMGVMSDAVHMEKLTGVPALAWTVMWAVISIIAFIYAFWLAYRPTKTTQGPAADTTSSASAGVADDKQLLEFTKEAESAPDATIDVTAKTESKERIL